MNIDPYSIEFFFLAQEKLKFVKNAGLALIRRRSAPKQSKSAPVRRRLEISIFQGSKKSQNFNVARVYINDEVTIDTRLTTASSKGFLANLFF